MLVIRLHSVVGPMSFWFFREALEVKYRWHRARCFGTCMKQVFVVVQCGSFRAPCTVVRSLTYTHS